MIMPNTCRCYEPHLASVQVSAVYLQVLRTARAQRPPRGLEPGSGRRAHRTRTWPRPKRGPSRPKPGQVPPGQRLADPARRRHLSLACCGGGAAAPGITAGRGPPAVWAPRSGLRGPPARCTCGCLPQCRRYCNTACMTAAGAALASLTPGTGTTTWASGGHVSAGRREYRECLWALTALRAGRR